MKLDLKLQHDDFVKMNFEEKRGFVASLLEGIKEGDELFTDLYNLIVSDMAIEQDFYDIYDSLIIVLYKDEKKSEQSAMIRLNEIKDWLVLQKQKEEKEKNEGVNEAANLIKEMF